MSGIEGYVGIYGYSQVWSPEMEGNGLSAWGPILPAGIDQPEHAKLSTCRVEGA